MKQNRRIGLRETLVQSSETSFWPRSKFHWYYQVVLQQCHVKVNATKACKNLNRIEQKVKSDGFFVFIYTNCSQLHHDVLLRIINSDRIASEIISSLVLKEPL